MKRFINAGFCEPFNPEVAAKCVELGDGIRTGVAVNDEHPMIATLVEDALLYFEEAIFIVGGWDWRKPTGGLVQDRDANLEPQAEHLANQCSSLIAEWSSRGGDTSRLWIEFGNELDGSYWKEDLRGYVRTAMVSYDRVRSLSPLVPFVTGSTMNLNREMGWQRGGLEILDLLCKFPWPTDTIQGLHPYRGGGRDWPSFASDQEALEELERILRGRELGITEMSWSSGSEHTDEEIAEMVRDEVQMWDDFGSVCYCHYQIQDGPFPSNAGEHGFGACTHVVDGLVEKPVAEVLRSGKGAL